MCLVNVIGLDASLTATGWAVISCNLEGEYNSLKGYGIIRGNKLRDVERLIDIEKKLRVILFAYSPIVAFIEGYAFGFKKEQGRYRESAGELGGIIRRLLFINGIGKEVIPPKSMKKIFVGNGNADKDSVSNLAKKLSKCDFADVAKYLRDNVTDAFALAYSGAKEFGLKGYVDGR